MATLFAQWTVTSARWLCSALLALVVGSSACAPDPDQGNVVVVWTGRLSPVARAVRNNRWIEKYAATFDQRFKLPDDVQVVHRSCGEPRARYIPALRQIELCYELLDQIAAQYSAGIENLDEYNSALKATWAFVFLHELAHAVIDQYDVPIITREEDAADGFAAMFLIRSNAADAALLAADLWNPELVTQPVVQSAADEHSFNAQRYYNMLCLVYGSAPRRYEALTANGTLPDARAEKCRAEYNEQLEAWERLLEPWLKPLDEG